METALIETVAPDAAEVRIIQEDFETIVRENQRRIYRLLLALLRDSDDADSLTQECFLRAFRKRATTSPSSATTTSAPSQSRAWFEGNRLFTGPEPADQASSANPVSAAGVYA